MRRRISPPVRFGTPALERLGLALPPPFVGRSAELAELGRALGETAVVMIVGGVGAGKTRLSRELAGRPALSGGLVGARIRCHAGDRPVAVRARAERALGVVPGGLDGALRERPRLLVVDDAHFIGGGGATEAFDAIIRGVGLGRLVLVSREALALPRSAPVRFQLTLEGLDPAAARELWAHLEETYGPTRAGACDDALCRTRGMPLALRRAYAAARASVGVEPSGDGAADPGELSREVAAALEATCVMAVPVAPSGVAALAPDVEVEPALIELVSRQLIDPLDDGRFEVHEQVRERVLGGMSEAARTALERAAAELVLRGAADDGALGLVDPVDRVRLAVGHLLAAGDVAGAAEVVCRLGPGQVVRASAGEVLGLIEQVTAAAEAGARGGGSGRAQGRHPGAARRGGGGARGRRTGRSGAAGPSAVSRR